MEELNEAFREIKTENYQLKNELAASSIDH